jgi:hypothetical protein
MRWRSSGTLFDGGGSSEEVGDGRSSEGKGECSVGADGDGSRDRNEGFHVCRSGIAISIDIEFSRSGLASVTEIQLKQTSKG